jgi:hypothetical protein
MATILQPGEYLDPATNTVWIQMPLSSTEPCDEHGCFLLARYELERTLTGIAKVSYRCEQHAPRFVIGTGQAIGGVVRVGPSPLVPNGYEINIDWGKQAKRFFDATDPVVMRKPDCAECYGTGYFHGMGRACSKGCKQT